MKRNRPSCAGCGMEFRLLTMLGLKKIPDMYCLQCEAIREKLKGQVDAWHAMDLRVKAHILPQVKELNRMEVFSARPGK